jgi:hypothetical protein
MAAAHHGNTVVGYRKQVFLDNLYSHRESQEILYEGRSDKKIVSKMGSETL